MATNKSRRQLSAERARQIKRAKKAKATKSTNENLDHSPLRISQYGDVNVYENLASPEQMKELHQQFSRRFDEVCREIATAVAKCQEVIRLVDPVTLLHRCFWNWTKHSLEAPDEESQQSDERNEAFQLLEYAQKLIGGISSVANAPPITDEQFAELSSATRDVFRLFQVEYFLCRSSRFSERPDYNIDLDEYAVRTEMNWIHVRGLRYLQHEAPYFRRMLAPQSELLQLVYGLTADSVANGVEKLLSSLLKELGTVIEEMTAFQSNTIDAIAADESLSRMPPPDAMDFVLRRNGWESRRDSVFGKLFGTDLFDVEKVTGWPLKFIEDLSLRPGEDSEFVDGGTESAWPTRFSRMNLAPFIRVNGKSFCFHVYGLTDRLYRAIEKGVARRQPSSGDRWNRGQKKASESLTAELFSRLLPGAQLFTDVHYCVTDHATGETKWTECDLLVIYERRLFVVEVKAARYAHKPPGRHIRDHLKSLRELIEEAASQANRLLEELEFKKELTVYDARRRKLVTLRNDGFDQIIRTCVSLDQIDDIASHAEDLVKLGIDIGPAPVWTISINDLLVCADIFRNPLIFLDYLGERMRAFSSPHCQVSDELDHLGLYLQINRYVMRAEKYAPAKGIAWHGYRDAFDRYYAAIWRGNQAQLPSQDLPRWIEELVDFLAQSREPGRIQIAEILLSLDGETRDGLGKQIERVRYLQREQYRPRPFTVGGDVQLTFSVSQQGSYQADFDEAREHTITAMTLQKESDRILIWLKYSDQSKLAEARWAFLTTADAAVIDSHVLNERVDRLRRRREDKLSG